MPHVRFTGRTTQTVKEGELATTSLEFEFHLQFPCGSPSTEVSDFRQLVQSGNECKSGMQTNIEKHAPRVVNSLLMSSNSRDVVSSSPSFSRPVAKAPWRDCSQVTWQQGASSHNYIVWLNTQFIS